MTDSLRCFLSQNNLPRRQWSAMKIAVRMFLLVRLLQSLLAAHDNVRELSELPLSELLVQKREVEEKKSEEAPSALAFVGEIPRESGSEERLKMLREMPERKSFYEEDLEDEKGSVSKKKEKHKVHDILNTSIMALSYLAFGGYLLCMIASTLREKRRRYAMAYPTTAPTLNNQFAQVLQHYMSHRPVRPFIRFPAVTVHKGGKEQRRRFPQRDAPQIVPRKPRGHPTSV